MPERNRTPLSPVRAADYAPLKPDISASTKRKASQMEDRQGDRRFESQDPDPTVGKRVREIPSTPSRPPLRDRHEESERQQHHSPAVEQTGSTGTPPSPILGEPASSAADTQAIFEEPTQALDLDIIEPGGGWEEDTGDAEGEVHETDDADGAKEHAGHSPDLDKVHYTTQNTQSFFTDSDSPDDEIVPTVPLPPDWDENATPPKASSRRASAASENQLESPSPTDDESVKLNGWIDALVAKGAKEEDVLTSLKVSSMNIVTAQVVLISIAQGLGVPKDMPGVWSEEEDQILRGGSARKIEELRIKHGSDKWDERLKYLENYGP